MARRSVDIQLPVRLGKRFEAQLRHLLSGLGRGFAATYLRQEVWSKYLDESLVPAAERKRAAIEKFSVAEARNRVTNARLYLGFDTPDWGWCDHDSFLRKVREIISVTLGPIPYPSVLQRATYTNGASTRVSRSPGSSCEKLTGEVDISSSAVKHWMAAFGGTLMSSQTLSIRESSILFTVPKKTEIDRCACKEPEGNMLLQRSVGLYIRDRLRKYGIDLRDQSVNRGLAQRAYAEGLATIDLSSASDTISHQLVYQLLPFDWYWLLDDLRVKETIINGEPHSLEMFSSMGNGFTFELETLLFWALARATAWFSRTRGRISVYGDDIIVPAVMARRLMRVFSWFGFIPNPAKTFITGPFRESCGGHYWRGFDVTPFYVRKAVRTLPDLVNVLNSLLEWDCRGVGFFTTKEVASFWSSWALVVPPEIWGGIDPRDPSALVTGCRPRKRLVAQRRAFGVQEEGRFRNWLLQAERTRGRDDPLVVDPQVELNDYRFVRVVSCGERSAYDPLYTWRVTDLGESGGRWGP